MFKFSADYADLSFELHVEQVRDGEEVVGYITLDGNDTAADVVDKTAADDDVLAQMENDNATLFQTVLSKNWERFYEVLNKYNAWQETC
jgi:hypothetical protein